VGNHLEDSSIDGRILLRWIFRKLYGWGGGAGTGLFWLGMGTGGGGTGEWGKEVGVSKNKMRGIS